MNTPMPPLVIVWRITEACNLNCQFCAYSKALQKPTHSADRSEVERFGRLLFEYKKNTGREILVSWLGGEPFLWKPILELSELFAQNGIKIATTTNGTPFTSPKIRQHVLDNYTELTFSLDGLADFNDWARMQTGLFAQLETNIKALQAEKIAQNRPLKLRVNTILMRENIAHFETLCEQLAAWGIQELTFNQLGGNDRPEFYPANRLTPEQVEDFIQNFEPLRLRAAARGLKIFGSPQYLNRFICTSKGLKIPIADCKPGAWFWFIDEQARMSPCSFTVGGYNLPLASIQTIADLEAVPARFSDLRAQNILPACMDCHSTQVFEKFD
jgi:sulfatase maturation enzyme AslB (radical SAM superfamily)